MKIKLTDHYIWSNPDNYVISRNSAKALGYYQTLRFLYTRMVINKIKDSNIELLKKLVEQENRVKMFFENNHNLEYKNIDIDNQYFIGVTNSMLILYKYRGENGDRHKVVVYPSNPQGALYHHFHNMTRLSEISDFDGYEKHIDEMIKVYKRFYDSYGIKI
jgi:hypothetical protein